MTQAELAERVGCALVTIKKIEQATPAPHARWPNCWLRRWQSRGGSGHVPAYGAPSVRRAIRHAVCR
ncbi:MAG: helix-turn-helix transcriptional regulator [Anaerolineae bacterium]|nr:helix-turn-helix transcriptional regulator [Anaerolineae bacterium]